MTAEQIEEAFRTRGIVRGGILLLRASEALEMIESARVHQIAILGIDAFRIGESSTQPLSEYSADLSSSEPNGDTWDKAAAVVKGHRESDLHFEVVFA